MGAIRLYLDEDVRPLLGVVLRERGYDVVSAIELGRIGLTDADHFRHAALDGRALLTFNICDFVPLASKAMHEGTRFAGLVVSDQLPFRELLRRTLRLQRKLVAFLGMMRPSMTRMKSPAYPCI